MPFTVNITNKCNMSCSFCLKQQEKLNEESFSCLLSSLSNYLSAHTENEIYITGGEPLINRDKLIQVINLIQQLNPECRIVINTNGSLINAEWVDYFNRNKIILGISLHGLNGVKSVNEAIQLGKNNLLVFDILNIENFNIKKVIQPNEIFVYDILDLRKVFNKSISLFLDITSEFDATALLTIELQLKKLYSIDNFSPSWLSFSDTSALCDYSQLVMNTDGELKKSCNKLLNSNWNGCNKLFKILGEDGFYYLIDVINRFNNNLV